MRTAKIYLAFVCTVLFMSNSVMAETGPTTYVDLDGRAIESMDTFCDQISEAFEFPNYFGRNLDALWDQLYEFEGPVSIVWEFSNHSSLRIGSDFQKLTLLFQELSKARPDIHIELH